MSRIAFTIAMTIAVFISTPLRAVAETPQETVTRLNRIANAGDTMGYTLSAQYLRYWLSAQGRDQSLPATKISGNGNLISHIQADHFPQIQAGVGRRLLARQQNGQPMTGWSETLTWADTFRGSGDLYYAIGTFTTESTVKITVQSRTANGLYVVRIDSWTVQGRDLYDWDPNSRYVFFDGSVVTGQQMQAVLNARLAKNFNVRSAWVPMTDQYLTASFYARP